MENSDIKYLKSISSKFDAKVSNEPLQNLFESVEVIFLLTIILVYFSIVLEITSIVRSKLFSSLKVMCPSYPSKLWKTIGNYLDIPNFKLRLLCAAPLNLPIIWQWSLTLPVFNYSLQMWHMFQLL